ncbi:MAG: GNAT family N-acetyltransferase [Chthoniobacterales bacterium]
MRLKKTSPVKSPSGNGLGFELKIHNDVRAYAMVEAFSREILSHASLAPKIQEGLASLILAAAADAIEHAYPPGENGPIVISSTQDNHQILITIRDYGLPQDLPQLEAAIHANTKAKRRMALGIDWAHLADELHWISYGPEGKALCITRWLHETSIVDHPERGDLTPFTEQTPAAPPHNYEIRRMRADEAVQVSQLMYKAYGSSYFNQDVYYPERVAALNKNGDILSFVAVDETGCLAGHYALEKNQDGPVMEGGQAVVDPAHRGRHLLERLKDAAIAAAKDLHLIGLWADAVTVHTFTQKANIEHGAHLACINLGISPQDEVFRGIDQSLQVQRVTCVLYFLWLKPAEARVVFAPARHEDALEKLYANLGCPVTFGEPRQPEGHGELLLHLNQNAMTGFARILKTGSDSAAAIRHAKREMIEKSHAQTVFAELPLWQPGTPAISEALAAEGFSFCGIAPHFCEGGDLLRMVYLTGELAPEPIHLQEDIARWLLSYALDDHRRVTGD